MEGINGWVPYVEVDDLATAAAKANENDATIIAEN